MTVERTPKITRGVQNRQVRRRLNLRILPFLVLLLGILYIITGYKGWLVFFIGLAGAWLIAWLWVRSITRSLRLERKIHMAWASVGESVPEQVRLVNPGWLPAMWVEITDQSEALETPLRMVSDVGRRSTRTRNLSHLFRRRGLYTLGPTHLRSGDPFGIYTISMQDRYAATILITPPVLPLGQLSIPSGGWTGDDRYRQATIERNISDAGLRNYVPGDSLRRIHWRASAHFDTLIVRQQEAATARDWLIYVDLDREAQAGRGEHTTLELSIVIAASLAMRGLREYRRVGLVLAGPQFISLQPGTDPSRGWRILRALAMAEAGSRSLSDLIRQGPTNPPATVILITASTNPAWVAEANHHFQGGSRLALLVDPTEFGHPQDQAKILSALARSRFPYTRIPGAWLEGAYATSRQGGGRSVRATESLRRYLQKGRQAWQSMD